MFFLNIINFHFFLSASLGVVGSQTAGFFKGSVGKFFCAFGFDDYMRAWSVLGVEPPVITSCKFKGQFIVLIIVFAYIHMEAVTADIVEGLTCDFHFLIAAFTVDIAAFNQLFLNLSQIFFQKCNIQRILNGFQMVDFFLYFQGQLGKCFIGTLQLAVFVKILLGIFRGSQLWVKGNGNHFICVIIQCFHGFGAKLHTIAVGV